MLILAGKEQLPREEQSLPCQGGMGDMLSFLSYPFMNP
jgi:hypothetical protein